jgi:hypothetical protein
MTTTMETPTLRQMLSAAGSRWAETGWDAPKSEAIDDIIDRFDDCPEGLRDFYQSDWVNLCECYTYQLLQRWERQADAIRSLFNDYCEAVGASSTLHALEGECDAFEDGDDLNAAIVNHAMTWGALELCREVWPND